MTDLEKLEYKLKELNIVYDKGEAYKAFYICSYEYIKDYNESDKAIYSYIEHDFDENESYMRSVVLHKALVWKRSIGGTGRLGDVCQIF